MGGDVKLEFLHSSFVLSTEPGMSGQYTPMEKERYFSLTTFKSDGAIGIKFGGGIHSSVFNENLFGFTG